MTPIRLLSTGFPVDVCLQEIDSNPDVWDRYTLRTSQYSSPHTKISDIWVRYNSWDNYKGDRKKFNEEHDSVWYPVICQIPSVRSLVMDVLSYVQGERLGGVLITRIPPGCMVRPHIDTGWHATYYDKYAIQLRGNGKQAFHFNDTSLSAMPGDLYTFDNSKLHWVTNESDEERMTLIICIRGSKFPQYCSHREN
jgi:hypothetical protein